MKLKRAGFVTKIVVVVLIIFLSVTLINKKSQIEKLLDHKQELEENVTNKRITNAALEYELEHRNDDDTIADIARDELGLVSPGEIVFYDSTR
ncbi:MAG: septum formation initiator family protein [Oscillospiraceae bacterium]|nr:septum formation initiator family protein [Oscillospiraceae bacterium]